MKSYKLFVREVYHISATYLMSSEGVNKMFVRLRRVPMWHSRRTKHIKCYLPPSHVRRASKELSQFHVSGIEYLFLYVSRTDIEDACSTSHDSPLKPFKSCRLDHVEALVVVF